MSERGDQHGDILASALVDESLVDAMLSLSPEERLRQNDRMVRSILLLRQGLAATDPGRDGGER